MNIGTRARAPRGAGDGSRLTTTRGPRCAVTETEVPPQATSPLATVSNALVALHKEQFGRGPTRARSEYAGPDALLCILEDALLPAEKAMVALGEGYRVQESRMFFQGATSNKFIAAIEQILDRKVRAFTSATAPDQTMIFEIYVFEPLARAA
jgi:uncharacterized protein YbcI